jgi:hypothetical protein
MDGHRRTQTCLRPPKADYDAAGEMDGVDGTVRHFDKLTTGGIWGIENAEFRVENFEGESIIMGRKECVKFIIGEATRTVKTVENNGNSIPSDE